MIALPTFKEGLKNQGSAPGYNYGLTSQYSSQSIGNFTIVPDSDSVDRISAWTDTVGGINASQSTAGLRPGYGACLDTTFNTNTFLTTADQGFGTGNFTVSTFVKSNSGSNNFIYSSRRTTNLNDGLSIAFDTGSVIQALLNVNGTIYTASVSVAGQAFEYYKVTVTVDRSGLMTLFVNNATSVTVDISASVGISISHGEENYLGTRSGSLNCNAMVREFMIYKGVSIYAPQVTNLHSYLDSSYPALSVTAKYSPYNWYDFNDAATITLVSSKISQITDKGSNAATLTQSASANRPTQSTVNGLNAGLFNGTPITGLGVQKTASNYPTRATQICVFSIQSTLASPSMVAGQGFAGNTTNEIQSMTCSATDTPASRVKDGTTASVSTFGSAFTYGQPNILVNQIQPIATGIYNIKIARINGSYNQQVAASLASGDGLINAPTTANERYFGVGMYNLGAARVTPVKDMCEFIVYSGKVYNDDIYRIMEGLKTKWGVA